MKRFDSEAILNRMLERVRVSEKWAMILNNGTVASLLKTTSEGFAELARYFEFCLNEKKWKSAMNISSLMHQADMISYKRQLPQSAIGFVIVSHSDDNGENRLANLGSYFFDIDARSNFDDLEEDADDTLEARRALVPWTNTRKYAVPKGTRFISSSGIEFFATQSITSKTLTKPWSQIVNDDSMLAAFQSNGGWNRIKYLKVPVIQGKQKTASLGMTAHERFESFMLAASNVENASNYVSKDFFKVRLVGSDGSEETWTEIDNINRANAYDKVFEKRLAKSGDGLIIKFGDGITGTIPAEGKEVFVDYIETLGSAGNIDSKFQITKMVFPSGADQVDPRTNTKKTFLFCTNNSPIQGGKDIEDIDSFRVNAPASYLNSYTISTVSKYEEMIKRFSPLSILHLKVWFEKSITNKPVSSSSDSTTDTVYNEVSLVSKNTNITFLTANGSALDEDEAEENVMQSIRLSLSNQTSPNDSLQYVKTNKVEVIPSVRVYSSDLTTEESTVESMSKTAIALEYDVANQEYGKSIYSSRIIQLVKMLPFADSVSLLQEAKAVLDYDDVYLVDMNISNSTDQSNYLLAFPFTFDKVFSQNSLESGFKDCTLNSDYLIKVNLTFTNSNSSAAARTFFLYDNRQDESKSTSLQKAKLLDKDGNTLSYRRLIKSDSDEIYIMKEYENGYDNRQVRVAQYPYIDSITDTVYMQNVKSYTQAPYEIRPYIQNTEGENELFTTNLVSTDQQAPLSGEDGSIGSTCYKKNLNYIDNVDIQFDEEVSDDDSGTGTFYLPLSYLGFSDSVLDMSMYESETNNFYYTLRSQLSQYVKIDVIAIPKASDFSPNKENDFLYVNKDDIKVVKTLML